MTDKFENLKSEVSNCTKCSLSSTRNRVVFGGGNPDAEIFVIAEGPGYEEDLQGIPFVGKSGKLLDKIFAACGFTREQHVYISNIVKCHPPGNRAPSKVEQAACLPYLIKQIDLVDPKIIILLGATALQGLINPNLKITKIRGEWIDWNNRLVMPVFHPSALLRNPDLKRPAWEDFKKVVLKYRELVDPGHYSKHI
ncbi:MAG: uracil-DNA glycosylase [Bacteroidetes bacterium]|nr:uracil-DNA glycosylase [Bacteroidota bacterium]